MKGITASAGQFIIPAFYALISYWIIWIIYALYFHPLSNIPGPWLASISRAWYIIQILKGNMEKTQRTLHAKYGPLLRIAPNEIACASPDAIKIIYRKSGGLDKTDFYSVWNTQSFSKHGDAFTETSDKAHGERRRIVNHIYALSNVLKSEQYIDACSELFVQRLNEHAELAQPFNLGKWVQWYAFDVVGELYFGSMFGFLQDSEDHKNWIHSIDLLFPFLCICAVAPSYLRPFILIAALMVPGGLNALKAIDTMGSAARQCVAQRFNAENKPEGHRRTDILEQLYHIHLEKGPKVDFNLGEIEQEAYAALVVGSDTTAIAMRSVMYHLMQNPNVYDELMLELDLATKEGRLSLPAKYAETVQLPYLCACIKEALRIHPGVQLTMGRIVPTEGLRLCGKFIPAGYWVGMNAAVVHFDKSVFGEDADEYRPSRWLQPNAVNMDKYMLHFGAGTRTCIGKNISMAEIHKLIPQVLRSFKFEMWEKESRWTTVNLWFCRQENLQVRLVKR